MKYELRKATRQYLLLLTMLLCTLLLITCLGNDNPKSDQRDYDEINRLKPQNEQRVENRDNRGE
ncbi:MAG: hypothetical protein II299_00235 [Alistipes sp.]|nr:hypothetical protein [Alistipes sp.]